MILYPGLIKKNHWSKVGCPNLMGVSLFALYYILQKSTQKRRIFTYFIVILNKVTGLRDRSLNAQFTRPYFSFLPSLLISESGYETNEKSMVIPCCG